VDEVLAEDLSNLRSFYALEGFHRARIGPPRIDETEDRLRVTIPIEEGPRRLVESVVIDGLSQIPVEDALRGSTLGAGAGFHPFHLDAAVEGLQVRLDERGYRSAICDVGFDERVTRIVCHRSEVLQSSRIGELVEINDRLIVVRQPVENEVGSDKPDATGN